MKNLITVAAVALFVGLSAQRAYAMPPFAQANAIDCSACHTMMPALNAYGRYIQRTAYGGLDYHLLHGHSPFWINERIRGKSTGNLDKNAPGFKTTWGNVAVDAVGALDGAWTYRVEQTLYSNNVGGGSTGQFWIAYNKLLGGKAHWLVGKIEPAVPGPFTQWQDMSGFSSPGIAVGKHKYNLTGSRWGTRIDYVGEKFALEAGWGAGSHSMLTAGDWSVAPGTDKVFQWVASIADPSKPFEYGLYGATGGYVISPQYLDRYTAYGFYAQRDPFQGWPGFYGYYQIGNDSNPGQAPVGSLPDTLPVPVSSHSYAFEVYQPFFNDQIMLGLRPMEITQSGLGPIKRYGNLDFGARVPYVPYLYFYAESGFWGNSAAPYGEPAWQWGFRWAGPIEGPINRIQ